MKRPPSYKVYCWFYCSSWQLFLVLWFEIQWKCLKMSILCVKIYCSLDTGRLCDLLHVTYCPFQTVSVKQYLLLARSVRYSSGKWARKNDSPSSLTGGQCRENLHEQKSKPPYFSVTGDELGFCQNCIFCSCNKYIMTFALVG